MLKKLLEFTGDPQTVMTVVTVCTLAISIIALIVDEPSPGVAYVMGFLNAALILLLYFYNEENES